MWDGKKTVATRIFYDSLEIISKLTTYKSLSARKRLLSSIPPEDNFWFEAHHGLSHFTPWPIRFVLDEQKHAATVRYEDIPNVLRMIIDGMLDGSLGEKGLTRAVTALSLRCDAYEWEYWFKPVLTKSLRLPVTISVFNEYAPEHLKVPGMPVAPQIDISGVNSMPAEFYVEPLIVSETQKVLWFLNKDGVTSYLEDGTHMSFSVNVLFEHIMEKSPDVDLILFGYMESEGITLTDLHDRTLFLEGGRSQMPLNKRYEALRYIAEMLEQSGIMDHVFVYPVEAHLCKLDDPKTTREAFNTIVQQGFPGVVLRHDHGPRVIVHPTRKSVMTCTDITEGDGKLAGVAEYVVGTGTLSRKKFTSPVFSGLTFDARRTILQGKAEHIGQKFEVLSCGLGPDGKLVFPVFQKWRTKDD